MLFSWMVAVHLIASNAFPAISIDKQLYCMISGDEKESTQTQQCFHISDNEEECDEPIEEAQFSR